MNKLRSTLFVHCHEQPVQQNSPNRLGLIPFLILTVCFLVLLTYSVSRWRATVAHPLRQIELQGEWIRSPGEPGFSGFFRKRFDISSRVRHAWLRIAAKDGFEVSINRNPVSRLYLWRPTRPFQNGGSEKGQTVVNQQAALALNFPREYQWDGHNNWMLPTYVEITNELQIGKNVVCIELESRSAPAAVNLYGEIVLWNGDIIPIRSDESWNAEPVPPGPQVLDWTEPGYWDKSWRKAELASVAIKNVWRSFPEGIYTQPFRGSWMRPQHHHTSQELTFATRWFLEGDIDEAWIRILANRRYELFINQQRVTVSHTRATDLDNGQWVLGRNSALDPVSKPELLDPDEVGEFFAGEQFMNPRDAQPNLEEFINLKPKTHLPFRNYKTTNRAEEGGEFDPLRTLAESRRTPAKPDLPPERPISNSLKRDRSVGGYLAYSVRKLLRSGWNEIEIRCIDEPNFNWQPTIAVDGLARFNSGPTSTIPHPGEWVSKQSAIGPECPVQAIGPAHQVGQTLPRLTYRGVAKEPMTIGQRFPGQFAKIGLFGLLAIVVVVSIAWAIPKLSTRRTDSVEAQIEKTELHETEQPLWRSVFETLFAMMLVASVTLLAGVLLEMCLQERHEILWFMRGTGWLILFLATGAMALLIGLADTIGRCRLSRLRQSGHWLSANICELPKTRVWPYLIIWVLMMCALLRGYKLDMQPLDDDEYASTQAIMAILETGAPGFVPEHVYYTRSPLYHYVTAALAYPFGGNLWSLRLQSVLWSMATVLLAYICGSHLLKSRWIGFAAMVLLAIHPFEVFTGHVIRFYQMQQFFALLTIYLFCRGFVTDQKQSFRIATILVFLCAVLSQEISAVLGAPLLLGYILFAKDLGWQKNVQMIIVSLAVVLIVGLDLLAFKTLCLTRTEGVSPTAEAAIKPHFWYPLNLFSIFIGYSRLHIIPSFFLFLGLPLLWREQNRNAIALVVFLLSGVLMTNLLVSHVSLRYQYWLFPIWILVSLASLRFVLTSAVALVYTPAKNLNRYVTTLGSAFAIVLIAIVLSWSPWRIPGTYEMCLLGDSSGCLRWVKSQMRPDDKLAITEPHTHAAFLEAGRVDYDIAIPLLYDFAVMQDGRMIDRNGGGELISSLDDFVRVMERGERVWVLLNREKFRTRGKNMRWEYPGARFEAFLRKNCELKHRTYLWHAYLWDPSRGHLVNFNKQQ